MRLRKSSERQYRASSLTVTLPGCRYGVVSAGLVVFTLIFTDFGVPKVIGGLLQCRSRPTFIAR